MMPFIKLHEKIKFGKYVTNTTIDGFESSNAYIMIVHSTDDTTIPISYGYDLYYSRYKDNNRFPFIRYENKGHNIMYDPNDTYKDEFNEPFYVWRDNLDYDYAKKSNQERFIKDKTEYIHKNLDRTRWADRLDKEMFRQFVSFYDEHIG